MFRQRLNPIEPPWYATRMPGGVGGAAPRGAPLSRSIRFITCWFCAIPASLMSPRAKPDPCIEDMTQEQVSEMIRLIERI
jgi:hypothetical protein